MIHLIHFTVKCIILFMLYYDTLRCIKTHMLKTAESLPIKDSRTMETCRSAIFSASAENTGKNLKSKLTLRESRMQARTSVSMIKTEKP